MLGGRSYCPAAQFLYKRNDIERLSFAIPHVSKPIGVHNGPESFVELNFLYFWTNSLPRANLGLRY